MEIPQEEKFVRRDYTWRCENIPGYREKFAAASAANYRKRKAENPESYNQKKSSYWRERYHSNPDFRERVLASLRERRKKAKVEKQRSKEQNVPLKD